jgi:hypothetical protein
MAQIIIPGRWNRQPQGPVEADWNNIFSQNLSAAVYPLYNKTLYGCGKDTYKSVVTPTSNNFIAGINQNGNYLRTAYFELSYPLVNRHPWTTLAGDRTFLFMGAIANSNSNQRVLSTKMFTWYGLTLVTADTFGSLKVQASSNTTIESTAIQIGLAKPFVGLMWRNSTEIGLHIKGIGITTANIVGNEDEEAASILLGEGLTAAWNGVFAFNRYLEISERLALLDNPWQVFKPIKRQFWSQATNLLSARYARPIETISNSGWLASEGSDLPAMINEETPNDTTYIYSNTYAAVYEGKLQPVEDPNTSNAQVIKYKTRSLYGNTLIAKLKQGGTVIATRTHTNVPTEWTQYSMILTEAEADSITDYTDLRVNTEIG